MAYSFLRRHVTTNFQPNSTNTTSRPSSRSTAEEIHPKVPTSRETLFVQLRQRKSPRNARRFEFVHTSQPVSVTGRSRLLQCHWVRFQSPSDFHFRGSSRKNHWNNRPTSWVPILEPAMRKPLHNLRPHRYRPGTTGVGRHLEEARFEFCGGTCVASFASFFLQSFQKWGSTERQ